MARSRWCSAMRARSARCFAHSAGAQRRGPHSARPCHASHARRPASNFYSHYVCAPCCADRTAAPPAWRAPRTSSSRYLWMARCAAALRATFAWLGSPYPSPFPSAGRSGLLCACWSDLETQLAGRPPPLAACSQRQEPCEPARHGGWFLDPRVLGPRAPTLLARSGSAELGDRHSRVAPPSTRRRTHARRPSRLGDIVCAVCDVRPRAVA